MLTNTNTRISSNSNILFVDAINFTNLNPLLVILPSAYDSLRSRFRRHNLWLEEGLYVRLPYGHEDPKTYFYYDDQSHHYNFKPPKVVTRCRPQDVPHDLVTESSERRTGIWAHETHEPHSIGHQDHHDSSFHDQVSQTDYSKQYLSYLDKYFEFIIKNHIHLYNSR